MWLKWSYIVVKWTITFASTNNDDLRSKQLTFKNNAPFRLCMSKINNAFIKNAKDLDILMPMYNLLEDTDSYFMTVNLWYRWSN